MAGSPMKDAEFDMVDDNLRTSFQGPQTPGLNSDPSRACTRLSCNRTSAMAVASTLRAWPADSKYLWNALCLDAGQCGHISGLRIAGGARQGLLPLSQRTGFYGRQLGHEKGQLQVWDPVFWPQPEWVRHQPEWFTCSWPHSLVRNSTQRGDRQWPRL